jgi:hypothetical protein
MASGCTTFSDNKNAATVNGHELSIDEFEAVARDVANPDENGEIPGDVARQILTVWVQGQLVTDAIVAGGREIGPGDRDAAEARLVEAYGDSWQGFDEATQTFLIDSVAADEAVITDEDARAVYEGGIASSNVACLRFIIAEDQAAADEISAALASGQAFADVADAHPPAGADPATSPPGGVLVNPDNGSECFAADALATSLSDVLTATAIGEPTPAIPLQDQFVFFLQRPYDEVTEAAHALIAPTISDAAKNEMTADADANVNSRYGMWDAATATVVATR